MSKELPRNPPKECADVLSPKIPGEHYWKKKPKTIEAVYLTFSASTRDTYQPYDHAPQSDDDDGSVSSKFDRVNQPRFRAATSAQPFQNRKKHFKSFPRGNALIGHAPFAFFPRDAGRANRSKSAVTCPLSLILKMLKTSGKQPTIVQRTDAWIPKKNTEKRKF